MFKDGLSPKKRLIAYSLIAVTIGASVVGYVLATGLIGYQPYGPGTRPSVLLELTNYTITPDQNQPNPTVATLWLRNMGTTSTTISTIYIQNATSGTTYYTDHPNQNIGAQGGTAKVVLDTLGSGFYFNQGYSYALTVMSGSGSGSRFDIQS